MHRVELWSLANGINVLTPPTRANRVRRQKQKQHLDVKNHLATHLEPINAVDAKTLSLESLVTALQGTNAMPSLPEIYEWLSRAELSEDDLRPYLAFKEGNYWRHRVCRNEFVEMLVLCWRPGQRTPIHDHNGSHGGVRVHEGPLWETMFVYDEENGLRYT